jgi:hypothetical protein
LVWQIGTPDNEDSLTWSGNLLGRSWFINGMLITQASDYYFTAPI